MRVATLWISTSAHSNRAAPLVCRGEEIVKISAGSTTARRLPARPYSDRGDSPRGLRFDCWSERPLSDNCDCRWRCGVLSGRFTTAANWGRKARLISVPSGPGQTDPGREQPGQVPPGCGRIRRSCHDMVNDSCNDPFAGVGRNGRDFPAEVLQRKLPKCMVKHGAPLNWPRPRPLPLIYNLKFAFRRFVEELCLETQDGPG